MQNKHHHKSIHQHVERVLRHRLSLIIVTLGMVFGVLVVDSRFRNVMQEVYAQGWGWLGTYMHHEHPTHGHVLYSITRAARISGPGN